MRARGADSGEDSTVDAVAVLLPRLAPVAVLLTDDPDDAVRLLASFLSGPRALDRPDDALPALARRALRRPQWAAEQVLASVPGTAPTDEDTSLADALIALPDHVRVAVVLDQIPGGRDPALADPGTEAAVARLREDLARRDDVAGRERERATAPFRRPGSAPKPGSPTPDLPERLTALAAGRPLPATAAETIAAAVDAARSARRRRRRWLVGCVSAVAALVVLVPLLPRAPATPPPATIYGSPTAGSLAGDAAFLRAVRHAPWAGVPGAPDRGRVVFAGDVPGGRWALVAAGGSTSRPAATAWFTGPVGARPDRMTVSSLRFDPDPAEPVSLTDPGTGALVVLGAPGDRVRVSSRPQVGVDGSITRRFRGVATTHGLAVVRLEPVPGAAASGVRLEVERDGRRLDAAPPTVVTQTPVADPPITLSRPAAAPAAGDPAVQSRLRTVLGQLGEAATDTTVTALWSGNLPGPNDRPARLTVLAVPQPSGALVVTTPYGYAADGSGRSGSSWCGTGVLPAGIPPEHLVIAVQCDLSDLTVDREISRFLVVVAPPTATWMQLLDGSDAVLREQPLEDGVAVVRSPGEVARVAVTTGDGGTSSVVPLVDSDLTG